MNDIFDIEVILNKQNYGKIYNIGYIILTILLILIYISFTYEYTTYYNLRGTMINNKLEIIIPTEETKYIQKAHTLKCDNQNYYFQLVSIDNYSYTSEYYNDYQRLYLKVDGLTNINNYAYEIKIVKEKKKIIKYLEEYL